LSGDVAAAVAYARRGLSEIEPAADPHGAAYLHERLRWYLWEGGDQAGAERALDEAYALVPADPPNTARARVLAQLAGVRMRQGRLTESSALAEESNQMARSVGALPELAFALGVRAWDRTMLGLAVEGLADLRDAAAIADLLESAEGRALGVANRALMLLYLGRDGEALEVARAGRSTVRAVGLAALFDARLAATAAAACFRLGSWSDAAILCREALDEGPARADSVWVGAVAARLGAAMGDDDLVRAGFELSARDQSANLEPLYTSWLELARLEVARTAGSTDGSVSPETTRAPSRLPVDVIADEATASIAAATIRTAADRAEVARAAGFSSDADAESRLAVDLLTTWRARRAAAAGRTADEGGITAAEAMAEAELGRASGASDPALWERAVAAEEARALPYPAAYARFRHAESIVQRPTAVSRRDAVRAAAADEAQTARASAVALGARPLIEAIDSLIRRARLDDVPAGRRPTEAETATTPGLDQVAAFVERRGLTPREVEVLKLLAAGWSNGEIGRALFITRKTASVHISNILGKLGAANRVEAAAMAQRVGVVGPSRPGSALEELRERANSRV
ncbi:MAG TPA: response regulator transcription factor, partial [Candidatus Limnocylindrales bacterium]